MESRGHLNLMLLEVANLSLQGFNFLVALPYSLLKLEEFGANLLGVLLILRALLQNLLGVV